MTIAIIAARGGSRRLPRKNVKLFCGHPLVAWNITQAKCSHLIDKVVVTTDDDEIAQVAISYGAEVIRRPHWPDADECAANRPFMHAIDILRNKYSNFDTLITLLPTEPLLLPDDLDKAIKAYRELGADRLSPLIPQRETVIYYRINEFRANVVIFDKKYHYANQSVGWTITSPTWYMNTCSHMSDMDKDLDLVENWLFKEMYYYPMKCWQFSDVDTEEEFELGEVLMEHYILKGNGMKVYHDYANIGKDPELPLDEINLGKFAGNINQQ